MYIWDNRVEIENCVSEEVDEARAGMMEYAG